MLLLLPSDILNHVLAPFLQRRREGVALVHCCRELSATLDISKMSARLPHGVVWDHQRFTYVLYEEGIPRELLVHFFRQDSVYQRTQIDEHMTRHGAQETFRVNGNLFKRRCFNRGVVCGAEETFWATDKGQQRLENVLHHDGPFAHMQMHYHREGPVSHYGKLDRLLAFTRVGLWRYFDTKGKPMHDIWYDKQGHMISVETLPRRSKRKREREEREAEAEAAL